MTRLFLAAGVAALAIATPAAAKPGGGGGHGGGNGGGQAAPQQHGNGGNHGGGGGAPTANGGGHGHGGGGFAAPQMRVERQQFRAPKAQQQALRFERQQARNVERQRGFERQQARNVEGQRGLERQQARNIERQRGFERQQARNIEHQRGFERKAQEQAFRQNRELGRQAFDDQRRFAEAQQRFAGRNEVERARLDSFRNAQTRFVDDRIRGRGLIDGCPPGLWMKNNGCMPPGQAARLLGTPIATAAGIVPLSALPQSVNYLYPDTSDYYWRYGNGYLYQVDRGTSLISSLLPLVGGGYVPGQYLPASYMSSPVPDYWGLNSFYPDYGGVCNRYYGGVVYRTDCGTGFVEDVVPMYAGGYGVGQMLPSAYNYYNVPMQYRDLYYDTPDYGYWYAPGAIYQYDQQSSMITSVASLLSPGFAVGQQLPLGYDAYNVPYQYRATYYDTPDAWYRYNNGYIYQVDPVTQLVTAVVASLLT